MPTVYIRFSLHGSGPWQRAPLLERLIARAHSSPVTDWRAEAFRVIAVGNEPMPGVAAAALSSMAARAGPAARCAHGAWVCIASPVHWVAGMSNVTLAESGILRLGRAEGEGLAEDFGRVFGDSGVRLMVGDAPGRVRGGTSGGARDSASGDATLLCVFDRALTVATRDLDDVVGQDVFGYQPSGDDGPRLRGLMSEMEMWLFDHEINKQRALNSQPLITGLWLWGGGAVTFAPPRVHGWTAGCDPLFAALDPRAEFPGAGPSGAAAGGKKARGGDAAVICVDGPASEHWADVEARWLAPAVAALNAGRVDRLVLSAGRRSFDVGRGQRFLFWRRARPWWQSFGLEDSR